MRIISKFQDYYDGIQGYGFERTPVYLRNNVVVVADNVPPELDALYREIPQPPNQRKSWWDNDLEIEIILFCGKAYVLGLPANPQKYLENEIKHIKADYSARTAKGKVEAIERLMSGKSKTKTGKCAFNNPGIAEFLATIPREIGDEVHIAHQTPIVAYRRGSWYEYKRKMLFELNPNLKDRGFPSLLDPFTAYQEIDMYLGNQLAQQQEYGSTGSDEIIRDSKGFDEMSFKTYSPGKKQKRRKK